MKRVVLLITVFLVANSGCNDAQLQSLKEEKASLVAESEDLKSRLKKAKQEKVDLLQENVDLLEDLQHKRQQLQQLQDRLAVAQGKLEDLQESRKTPEQRLGLVDLQRRLAILSPEEKSWMHRALQRDKRGGVRSLSLPEAFLIDWAMAVDGRKWEQALSLRVAESKQKIKALESLSKSEQQELEVLIGKIENNRPLLERDWKLIRRKHWTILADLLVDAFMRHDKPMKDTMEFLNLGPDLKRRFVLLRNEPRTELMMNAKNMRDNPHKYVEDAAFWLSEYRQSVFLRGKIKDLEKELSVVGK